MKKISYPVIMVSIGSWKSQIKQNKVEKNSKQTNSIQSQMASYESICYKQINGLQERKT